MCDLPLVESKKILLNSDTVSVKFIMPSEIKHKKTFIYDSRDGFPKVCSEVMYS